MGEELVDNAENGVVPGYVGVRLVPRMEEELIGDGGMELFEPSKFPESNTSPVQCSLLKLFILLEDP